MKQNTVSMMITNNFSGIITLRKTDCVQHNINSPCKMMLAVHAAKTDIYFLIWHFLKMHSTDNTSALLSA